MSRPGPTRLQFPLIDYKKLLAASNFIARYILNSAYGTPASAASTFAGKSDEEDIENWMDEEASDEEAIEDCTVNGEAGGFPNRLSFEATIDLMDQDKPDLVAN